MINSAGEAQTEDWRVVVHHLEVAKRSQVGRRAVGGAG